MVGVRRSGDPPRSALARLGTPALGPGYGMNVWFRDHADPHMAVLMDSEDPSPPRTPTPGQTSPVTASRCRMRLRPRACFPTSAKRAVNQRESRALECIEGRSTRPGSYVKTVEGDHERSDGR